MKRIQISAARPYEVLLESGCLERAGEYLAPFCKHNYAAIITDDTVDGLYGKALEKSLKAANIRTVKFVFPHGENAKNAQTYIKILEFLAENQITRDDLLIALGGGVVGDMAGFAAATFMRGIAFVQIPTTLLAMVDSSVGGKTAINLEAGKNLAGAFHQPSLVLCDPLCLDSLPSPIFADGCGEVIKYGVLEGEALFSLLEASGPDFDRESVISACILAKAKLVRADEFDTGARQLLNLGHTIGHGIEKESEFSVSHGKAVSMGMVYAARCAAALGICAPSVSERIIKVCAAFGLPVETSFSPKTLASAMLFDKKRSGDCLTLVLPEKIGSCILYPVSTAELLPLLMGANA